MEAFFNHADASRANVSSSANASASVSSSANASASADSSMPMPPYRRPNVSQNHQILDILRLLIDNYSRSHQMYMIPIESMIYRMNSSSPSTDMSMLFHLQNNTHRRMNEYHHTMRDILQLIRQIHHSSHELPSVGGLSAPNLGVVHTEYVEGSSRTSPYRSSFQSPPSPHNQNHPPSTHDQNHPPSTHDQNHPPSHPVSSRIAESILNALLQSSSSTNPRTSHTGPLTEASFTFSMFAGEDEEEPHLHVTDEQMRQYTETYIYHIPPELPSVGGLSAPNLGDVQEEYVEGQPPQGMEGAIASRSARASPIGSSFQPPVFTSHYQEDQSNEVGPFSEPDVGLNEVGPNAVDASSTHRTCPITLEDFEPGESVIKINVCGHVFREAALRSWFERHRMCPVCRRDITVQQS